MDELLDRLTDAELDVLVGAIVAEKVTRGSDHDTALSEVVQAAVGGYNGSKAFDAEVDQ